MKVVQPVLAYLAFLNPVHSFVNTPLSSRAGSVGRKIFALSASSRSSSEIVPSFKVMDMVQRANELDEQVRKAVKKQAGSGTFRYRIPAIGSRSSKLQPKLTQLPSLLVSPYLPSYSLYAQGESIMHLEVRLDKD